MIDPPLPGASIVEGPCDWQILQRDERGEASLSLSGIYRTEAPRYRVEARIVRETDGAPVAEHLDWTEAELLPEKRWRVTLAAIPAGGLYRLETRVWRTECRDTRPMRGDYVHHLGVGDLWVIAGQSNASGTGTGPVEDPPTLGVHLFGNDETWKLACHPLEDATRTRHSITVHGVFQAHSPWLAFGRKLHHDLGIPVGLIPTAHGGSSIDQWQPGAGHYENMRDMIRLAGGRVRGVVWYQGESDTVAERWEAYEEKFGRFVRAAREALGAPNLPVLTAQLGRYADAVGDADRNAAWTRIREAQRRLAARIGPAPLVPAVDVPLCDSIHVSAAGNLQIGRRFAAAALRAVHGRPVPPPGIALRAAAWTEDDTPVIRLLFDPLVAGWVRSAPGSDFLVEDDRGGIGFEETLMDETSEIRLALERAPEGEVCVIGHPGCYPPVALSDRDQRPLLGFRVPVPYTRPEAAPGTA